LFSSRLMNQLPSSLFVRINDRNSSSRGSISLNITLPVVVSIISPSILTLTFSWIVIAPES